jgi:hypothetical protein
MLLLCHMAFCFHFFFLIEIWVKYSLFCDLNLKDKNLFCFLLFSKSLLSTSFYLFIL